MPAKKPHYRIAAKFSDGTTKNEEEIYDLTKIDGSWNVGRRGFSKGLLTIASLVAAGTALAGCGPSRKELLRRQNELEEQRTRERKRLEQEESEKKRKLQEKERSEKEKKGNEGKEIKVQIKDNVTGLVTTQTLPCGSPIPPGAICTCNCIPVVSKVTVPETRSYQYCQCVPVCSCNKICTCIPVV